MRGRWICVVSLSATTITGTACVLCSAYKAALFIEYEPRWTTNEILGAYHVVTYWTVGIWEQNPGINFHQMSFCVFHVRMMKPIHESIDSWLVKHSISTHSSIEWLHWYHYTKNLKENWLTFTKLNLMNSDLVSSQKYGFLCLPHTEV